MREYVIGGRDRVEDFNAARERSSRARRAEGKTGPVNEDWDRWFIERLVRRDLDPLFALSDEEIVAASGIGALEVRSWVSAFAAWGGDVDDAAYSPMPTWITGMG